MQKCWISVRLWIMYAKLLVCVGPRYNQHVVCSWYWDGASWSHLQHRGSRVHVFLLSIDLSRVSASLESCSDQLTDNPVCRQYAGFYGYHGRLPLLFPLRILLFQLAFVKEPKPVPSHVSWLNQKTKKLHSLNDSHFNGQSGYERNEDVRPCARFGYLSSSLCFLVHSKFSSFVYTSRPCVHSPTLTCVRVCKHAPVLRRLSLQWYPCVLWDVAPWFADPSTHSWYQVTGRISGFTTYLSLVL